MRLGKPLGTREQQVLQYLADGLTREAIAAELYVAQSTVATFRISLFEKLGARNAAQAVALGYQHGYLAVGEHLLEDLAVVREAREMGYRIALVPAEKGAA